MESLMCFGWLTKSFMRSWTQKITKEGLVNLSQSVSYAPYVLLSALFGTVKRFNASQPSEAATRWQHTCRQINQLQINPQKRLFDMENYCWVAIEIKLQWNWVIMYDLLVQLEFSGRYNITNIELAIFLNW